VFLIQFIGYWNDYNMALMFMPTQPTLAYGVYYMSVSNMNGLSSAPMRMVTCVILALPLITVFVVFRNKLMGNVTMGGVKE
jgi:ABC-type glycerol-3-phosphate transport system permease component